jgi:hypothetical protein
MQGFLDGKTGASDDLPSSNPNNSQSVRIGLRGDLSEQLDGRVAHVGIWNAALTDEEILRLAQGKLPPQVRPENLAGYWPLDDYASSGATREFRWNNRMGVHAGTVAPRPGPPIPYLAPHIFLQNLKQPNFQGGQLTVPIEAV